MPLLDDQWQNPLWAAFQSMRGRDPEQDTAPLPEVGQVPGDKLAMKMSQGLMAANPAAALGRAAIMEGGKALYDVYGGDEKLGEMKSAMRDYMFPPSYQGAPLRGSIQPQSYGNHYGMLKQPFYVGR